MWQAFNGASLWKLTAFFAVWGGAILGVLQLRHLPIDGSHNLCGPWGCGPPLPALLAYQGFWLVLLGFPALAASRLWSPVKLRRLGLVLLGLGLAGFVAIGVWDALFWWPTASPEGRALVVQRYLFSVATQIAMPVELPVIPVTLAGLGCLAGAAFRSRAQPPRSEKTELPAVDRRIGAG